MKVFRFAFILITLIAAEPSFAITDEELFRNFPFYFINPGARSGAMGGAFIALADDATAVEANPAGLTTLTEPEISFEFRNIRYDADKLNSSNFLDFFGTGASFFSSNDLNELNQPSFYSFVIPAGKSLTFAVSRQEILRIKGTIDESLFFTFDGVNYAIIADAQVDQKVYTNNLSGAFLIGNISIGGSVRYSQLEWNAIITNFQAVGEEFFPASETFIDDKDTSWSFNVGAIYRMSPKVSIGGVYKRNPKFDAVAVQTGEDPNYATKPGPFTNILKVPDTMGVGITVKPHDQLTVLVDAVRIEYSDLIEGFNAGYNPVTSNLTNRDIEYKVDNAFELHFGAEAVVFLKHIPLAFRQGYYKKAADSLRIKRFNGDEASREVLEGLFAQREDEHHFTLGAGIVLGEHFQVDWAWDLAPSTDHFVLSTVFLF